MRKKGNNNKHCEFLAIIEEDEDGVLVGSVPAVRGCHTQARSMPMLLKRLHEALKLCLEAKKEPVRPLRFVGIQEISV